MRSDGFACTREIVSGALTWMIAWLTVPLPGRFMTGYGHGRQHVKTCTPVYSATDAGLERQTSNVSNSPASRSRLLSWSSLDGFPAVYSQVATSQPIQSHLYALLCRVLVLKKLGDELLPHVSCPFVSFAHGYLQEADSCQSSL